MSPTLAVCELFHPKVHGFTNESSPSILGHYIVRFSVDTDEFMNINTLNEINSAIATIKLIFKKISSKYVPDKNDHVRNYKNIVGNPNFIRIEIIEKIRLSPGEEDIAIMKTCWLRIFQRKWRSVYKQIQIHKQQPSSIKYRELHGRWPSTI